MPPLPTSLFRLVLLLTATRAKKYEIRRPSSNYVDIYTNHPYTSDVIDSYRTTDFHRYPNYKIHRSGDRSTDDPYVYPASKFERDDVLHSDFGPFEGDAPVDDRRDAIGPQNATSNGYNFVFDDEKNLVYVQSVDDRKPDDDDHESDDADDDKRYVYLESQKHVVPNVGVRLSRRPNFQTAATHTTTPSDRLEGAFAYPKPTRHVKHLVENKSKFNEILRRYVTKLHGGNGVHHQSIEAVPSNAIVDDLKVPDKSKFLEVPLHQLKTKTLSLANKFLSLFTIVQFPNSRCVANSTVSTSYDGTCYHLSECAKLNGTAMGYCAKGFGVCCVFRGTCGGQSDRNCSYFESPSYPNYYPTDPSVLPPDFATTQAPPPGLTPDPRDYRHADHRYKRQVNVPESLSCVYRVFKSNANVQQMRIDFVDLELNGPTNGTCSDERLIISGFNVNPVPPLCGYNTGQHVYVDVAGMIGPLQLQVVANTVQRKRFKLRICQYGDTCTGSSGCLQYYTGVNGVISSFNYDQAAIFSRSTPSYFNNLNYAICIRREPGYCSVTYRNVNNGVVYPFELVNFMNGVATVPPGEAGVEIFNCPNDYIVLNGLRLCGYRLNDGSTVANFSLNAPVTDTSGGPIVIPVRTNNMNVGRGFRLFYMQNRCPT